jgi:ribonuclease Z
MSAHLKFAAVPTVDTPGTLLTLNFDDRRYLFGRVAEGSQRICRERGLNLVKTHAVFVTGNIGWENTGGLTGLALTLADTLKAHAKAMLDAGKEVNLEDGKEEGLTVYGGDGLLHSVACGRKYILRVGGHIKFREFEQTAYGEPDFTDDNIRVWKMKVKPAGNDGILVVSKNLEDITQTREKTRQTLNKVVKEMWESEWRIDNLVERELQHVPSRVAAVWVRDPDTKDLHPYKGPLPGGSNPLPDPTMKVLVRTPWPAAITGDITSFDSDREAISYLVKTYPRRGKFLAKKAKELKVKPGPNYALLASGVSVANDEGELITSDMVLEPERPGIGFFVVDIPSVEYIDNLVKRPEWNDTETMSGVEFVVWILGQGVSSSQKLVAFIDKMNHVKHIVSSPDHCPNTIAVDSARRIASLLNSVNANFTVPLFDNETLPQSQLSVNESNDTQLPAEVSAATILLNIAIRPKFDREMETPEPPRVLETSQSVLDSVIQANERNREYDEIFAKWRSTIALPETEVIFLGTGSAIPSLTRNVTGILLRVPGHGNYILDCGENTLGQLKRMYKRDELVEILRDLKMIWISHIHADHHLGTIGVLKAWYEVVHQSKPIPRSNSSHDIFLQLPESSASRERLAIVASTSFQEAIADFSKLEDIGYSRVLPIDHSPSTVDLEKKAVERPTTLRIITNLLTGKDTMDLEIDRTLGERIFGALDIQTVLVKHCRDSSGLCLTFNPTNALASSPPTEIHKQPFRVVWSGDCRPSAQLATIGQGADLLIHEATFGSKFHGQAQAKAHSTIDEAKRVAEAMGAKSLILTHFSQRYAKLPEMKELGGPLEGKEEAFKRLINTEVAEAPVDLEEEGEGEDLMDEAVASAEDGDKMIGVEKTNSTIADKQRQDSDTTAIDPENEVVGEDTEMMDNSMSIFANPPSKLPVCAAFDFMRIQVGDIPLMESFIPALVRQFSEVERVSDDSDSKAVHPKKKRYDDEKEQRKKRKTNKSSDTLVAKGKKPVVGGDQSKPVGLISQQREKERTKEGITKFRKGRYGDTSDDKTDDTPNDEPVIKPRINKGALADALQEGDMSATEPQNI